MRVSEEIEERKREYEDAEREAEGITYFACKRGAKQTDRVNNAQDPYGQALALKVLLKDYPELDWARDLYGLVKKAASQALPEHSNKVSYIQNDFLLECKELVEKIEKDCNAEQGS